MNKMNAELAQLVEQRIRNAWVGGSSPPFGSLLLKVHYDVPLFFSQQFQSTILLLNWVGSIYSKVLSTTTV